LQGNPEGKTRDVITKEDLIYITGFLDGDGCIMVQLVHHKDYRLVYEIRPSIVFYQKTINKDFLFWLKSKLEIGYIRDRNDGMSEYTIVGVKNAIRILNQFLPFLRLKKKQAKLALFVLKRMPESGRQMTAKLLYRLSKEVDKFASLNYSKKRTNTSVQVKKALLEKNLLIP